MSPSTTRVTAAAGLVAALAGCASPGPVARPEVQAPAAFTTTASAAAAGNQPWVLPTWWVAFEDAPMAAIVPAAIAASPSVPAAAARLERARAQRVAAEAARWPQADFGTGGQRARSAPKAPVASSAQFGVQAGWEIDLFGGQAASASAAAARVASAQAQLHGAQAAVAAEAAGNVVALRACEVLVEQLRSDAASREHTARLTELTARAGLSAPADAALARASAAQGRGQANAQQASCDALVQSLLELTGWRGHEFRQRWQTGRSNRAVPQPEALAVTTLPAQLLRQRPDLLDAEQAVLAAAGERSAAAAASLPKLSLAGNLSLASLRSAGVSTRGSTWSIGPVQLTLPVFDGGTRRANEAAARAEYDAAVAAYQGQLRRALREVEQALIALASSDQRRADARIAAEGFDAALRATESRHRGGLASQFELEDARRNALAAQRALIGLEQERAQAWIDLARALGGGWTPPTS